MRSPFALIQLLAFIFLIGLLVAIVQVGALTIAFDKLGLSMGSAFLLLFASLFGSAINLPLFQINANMPPPQPALNLFRLLRMPLAPFTGKTIIAINLGGGIIPIFFSLYLLANHPIPIGTVLLAITIVSLVCYVVSRPIPGLGVGMPILIAPLTAALVALLLGGEQSAPLAYVCGTLGVLLGADLLNMKEIRKLGTPLASIGGAGTFDGIFITGIVAVLLA